MHGRLGKGGYAYGQPKNLFGFSLSVTRRKVGCGQVRLTVKRREMTGSCRGEGMVA
jgi:hypothetical protein